MLGELREVVGVEREVRVLLRVDDPEHDIDEPDQAIGLGPVLGRRRIVVGEIEQDEPVERLLVVAVERGTPLAEVLRAQAQDVREEGRRLIMEAGGKKEIVMMVPVVFGVLPVTILFAMFPGLGFFQFQM